MSRGGARPGAGRPKGGANPTTRENRATIGELARKYANDAIKALVKVATEGDSESARVAAANALLDRGFGRPAQSMELTGKGGKDLVPESKGVLIVPGAMDEQAWEAMMDKRRGADAD